MAEETMTEHPSGGSVHDGRVETRFPPMRGIVPPPELVALEGDDMLAYLRLGDIDNVVLQLLEVWQRAEFATLPIRDLIPAMAFADSERFSTEEQSKLGVRAFNCLQRTGVHDWAALAEMSPDALMSITNFGVLSLRSVIGSSVRKSAELLAGGANELAEVHHDVNLQSLLPLRSDLLVSFLVSCRARLRELLPPLAQLDHKTIPEGLLPRRVAAGIGRETWTRFIELTFQEIAELDEVDEVALVTLWRRLCSVTSASAPASTGMEDSLQRMLATIGFVRSVETLGQALIVNPVLGRLPDELVDEWGRLADARLPALPELGHQLDEVFAGLSNRQLETMRSRVITLTRKVPHRELGRQLGVSGELIRQTEVKVIEHLQSACASDDLWLVRVAAQEVRMRLGAAVLADSDRVVGTRA